MIVVIGDGGFLLQALAVFHQTDEEIMSTHVNSILDTAGETCTAVARQIRQSQTVSGGVQSLKLVGISGRVEAESADQLHGNILSQYHDAESFGLQYGGSSEILLIDSNHDLLWGTGYLSSSVDDTAHTAAVMGRCDNVKTAGQAKKCF